MVTETLDRLLRGHQLATEGTDDGIRVPALGQTWQSAIGRELTHAVQLDVRIELWPGRWLVESVTGLGTGEQAIASAFEALAAGPLHVILDAFGASGSDQVERETWQIA